MVRSLVGSTNQSPFIPVGKNQTEMLLGPFNQLLGSFSVPDSCYTNSPLFWIQTVTDEAILQLTGKSLTIMLLTPQVDFSVKW